MSGSSNPGVTAAPPTTPTPRRISLGFTLTANFVPGVNVNFLTVPAGLSLNVDGRSNWIAYAFVWGVGDTHTASGARAADRRAGESVAIFRLEQ